MLRKVHLHGHLAKEFGKVHSLSVLTAGEALRAFGANFPTFWGKLRDGSYEIIVGKRRGGQALEVEDINDFRLGNGDLHIVPVVQGAKRGGVLKVILGAVLIGAAMFFSGGALGAALAPTGILSGITWGNVAFVGLAMGLAGASQLLTPQDNKKEDERSQSYSISGPTNSYEQGMPIPLIYGRVKVGAQVISAGYDVEQNGAVPT
jgi:predicted phage tail protein